MVTKHKILVVLGSTRDGRYGDKPAHWITQRLGEHAELEPELVDLRDYPLPFFDQKVPPARRNLGDYGHDAANALSGKLAAADGFVLITAEYNHGPTAVLKNALDWAFKEWNRKPVTFVGYGSVGGARAVEQLRMIAVELEMAPIRRAVHLPTDVFMATRTLPAPAPREAFASAEASATLMVDDLVWWTKALKTARTA
jgi:NAD(P)H-dependent FMN reductase